MPVMPSDSPSSPSDYDAVATQDMNIQADQPDLSGVQHGAEATSGAGVLYPMGPRQRETEDLLESPQGYADFDITAGYSGDWPNDPTPGG